MKGDRKMLLILTVLILLCSLILLLIRRDRRCTLIALTCVSLFIFIFSILTYIAKKGGIGSSVSWMLYASDRIRVWFQYRVVTLETLGFITALGRYTFPLLLVLTCLDMAYFDSALWMKKHFWLLFIIPAIIFTCYIPSLFRYLMNLNQGLLRFLVNFSRLYVYGYVILALAVIVREYFSITLYFFKRRFIFKSLIPAALALIFAMYAMQDPAQIYLFYHNEYMFLLGLWYLSPYFSPLLYTVVLFGSIASGIAGFISLLRYVRINIDERNEEITLKRNASLASKGVSMFIHGTKNELLAMSILLRRISVRHPEDEDILKACELSRQLNERLEELHLAARNRAATLSLCELTPVIESARERTCARYPDAEIRICGTDGLYVLADSGSLKEAIANILINAVEASRDAGSSDPVLLEYRPERLWISIKISDSGKGLGKKQLRQIYQPFYSSKNSSQNWGMGMYYTLNCVKAHLGSIKYEKRPEGGSSFIILLPRTGRPLTRGE